MGAILQLFFAKNHHVMTEKLASSYPMRRAAQLVASVYFQMEGALKKQATRAVQGQPKNSYPQGNSRMKDNNNNNSDGGFATNFRRHLKEEVDEFKRRKT